MTSEVGLAKPARYYKLISDLSRAYLGFEYIWIAIKGYFSA